MTPDPSPRSRAGNAMGRARAAILAGARASVVARGVSRTTMSAVADRAGVAKATLYNHFRSKDEVLDALVAAEVEAVAAAVDRCAADAAGAADRLVTAAGTLAGLASLRAVVDREPGVAAELLAPGDGPRWGAVRARAAQALADAGVRSDPVAVDLVLRWLTSCALAPADPQVTAAQAGLLVDALAG